MFILFAKILIFSVFPLFSGNLSQNFAYCWKTLELPVRILVTDRMNAEFLILHDLLADNLARVHFVLSSASVLLYWNRDDLSLIGNIDWYIKYCSRASKYITYSCLLKFLEFGDQAIFLCKTLQYFISSGISAFAYVFLTL